MISSVNEGLLQTGLPSLPAAATMTTPCEAAYAIDRYGSVSRVPGVLAVARGDPYVGY